MTDGDALRGAILANPECDTRRLVYADWLDEQERHGEAAIVRTRRAPHDAYSWRGRSEEGRKWRGYMRALVPGLKPRWRVRLDHGEVWADPSGIVDWRNALWLHLRHGHVEGVVGTTDVLQAMLPQMVREQPVERVAALVDCRHAEFNGTHRVAVIARPREVPPAVLRHLPVPTSDTHRGHQMAVFDTVRDARLAFGEAYLKWANGIARSNRSNLSSSCRSTGMTMVV